MSAALHIVLVHGAWVGGWEFAPVVPALEGRGFTVETVELPSTGSTDSLAADAAAVTEALDRASTPVLLVGHSYGGVPVTQAGAHPAVVGLVYVAAFALDEGQSVRSALGGEFPPGWHREDGQILLGATREERIGIVAADLPPGAPRAAAEQVADMFRPQSLTALSDPLTEVAWRTTPSWYVLTENDVLVPPGLQESFATRAGADVIRVATGHAPFQEDPAGFVDVIVGIAAPLRSSLPSADPIQERS
ncbi:alpha/beta hydrolase [Microbacterium sp. NPDC089189]|uniref:alpha/beta hydrolase n=1 Tax=Microbacterium sp. NPDC089189 TaxID=3154972 RepID=UPI003420A66C